MSSLVEKAEAFATDAHASIDQRRKYSDEPYIVHPRAVAATVASVTDDEAMIAAAWLHDVVEDTPVTNDEIRAAFGDDVADLVSQVTNVSKLSDGNRATRKAIDRKHVAAASPRGKTIKLADLIDNLDGITSENRGYAPKYLAEKREQLTVLGEGDRSLYQRVEQIIENEYAQLSQ